MEKNSFLVGFRNPPIIKSELLLVRDCNKYENEI